MIPAPCTGVSLDPDAPVPFALTAKARAYLDHPPLGVHAALAAHAAGAAVIGAALFLEAALAGATVPGNGEWSCERCGAAYFGTRPDDGLCQPCRNDRTAACASGEWHGPDCLCPYCTDECADCGATYNVQTGALTTPRLCGDCRNGG